MSVYKIWDTLTEETKQSFRDLFPFKHQIKELKQMYDLYIIHFGKYGVDSFHCAECRTQLVKYVGLVLTREGQLNKR